MSQVNNINWAETSIESYIANDDKNVDLKKLRECFQHHSLNNFISIELDIEDANEGDSSSSNAENRYFCVIYLTCINQSDCKKSYSPLACSFHEKSDFLVELQKQVLFFNNQLLLFLNEKNI